jgi:hypothetical protein
MNFEGYEGFEVTLRPMNLGELTSLLKNKEMFAKLSDEDGSVEQIEAVVEILSRYISSWNLEDEDGTTLPVTEEILYTLDLSLLMLIIKTWTDVMVSVPTPLEKK